MMTYDQSFLHYQPPTQWIDLNFSNVIYGRIWKVCQIVIENIEKYVYRGKYFFPVRGATQLLEDIKDFYLRLYIFFNIRLRKVKYKNDEQDYLKTHLWKEF